VPEENLLIVSTIDTVRIKDSYRKRIHFQNYPWVTWIEGIGSVKGLLFTSGSLPTNGAEGDLICFKQNGEILYFNNWYPDCFPVLTGIETKKNDLPGINIFPNPAKTQFIISNPSNIKIKKIELIDFSGRIVQMWNATECAGNTLNIQHISPGVYLLKAETDAGVKTEKLVVQ
jgi:hypothetical protein